MFCGGLAFAHEEGMREPSSPEQKAGPSKSASEHADPPHPDRARIDSDVRNLLRQPSTPWIVFDRDSRVDDFAKSALRVGAVFMSSPNFRPEVLKAAEETGRSLADVVAKPLPGLAPPPPPPPRVEIVAIPAAPVVIESSTTEQSIVAVVKDFAEDTSSTRAVEVAVATAAKPARSKQRALAAFACGAIVAVISAVGVLRVRSSNSVAAQPVQTTSLAKVAVEAPVDLPISTAAIVTDFEIPATAAVKAPDPKKRFGKLTIRAEAKHKNVYFDGKRMLGTGQRSFLVFCGMHTIAVTDKTDTKDVEIPCDGEYVVFR